MELPKNDFKLENTQNQGNINEKKSSKKVLSNRNFRLLWIGQSTSLIGDQFTMIALPWLVLLLTGDPLALGIILALEGVPRAIFMLLGGAITDKFSQRSVMIISDVARILLISAIALMIFSGNIQLWMLYLIALIFGTISGFFLPASNSMVPRIVNNEDIMAGNSIIQGTAQLSVFIGPLLAGGLIAFFSSSSISLGGGISSSMGGIGTALVIDALTFLVSIVTLWMMRVNLIQSEHEEVKDILYSIKEGVLFVRKTPKVLYMFVLISVVNFLFTGPFIVGIPVIANSRLAEGAAAFGIIMAAFGIGNLIGIIASGTIKIKPQKLGILTTIIVGIFGVFLALMGFISSIWMGFILVFILGAFNGYVGIVITTLLQKNTPPEMLGRMMSLVVLSMVGFVPISQAVSGALIKVSLEGLFAVCGMLIVLTAFIVVMSKEVKNFGLDAPQ
jgi:MFS family permease